MDIATKQLCRKNNVAKIVNIVIAATVLTISILQVLSGQGLIFISRAIVALIDIVLNVVLGKKFADQATYRHVCACTIGLTYIVLLATSPQAAYMYIYAFPIAVLLMIFEDSKLTLLGSIVAVVSSSAHVIVIFIKGLIGIDEVIIPILVVLIVCISATLITKIQIENKEESLSAVQASSDVQAHTSESIVELAHQLSTKFTEAKDVSTRLNEAMEDSNSAISDIAQSSRTNAESIQGQTEMTSDIQNEIKSVGDQSSNMSQISISTNTNVKEGVKLIDQLKAQASELSTINLESKELTQKLNDSIKDVEAITETILGISSQTNLLALNASIEAARAGEAGKGFAVVADEIRGLSEGTRAATEQISAIIDNLTADAESAAKSMTKSAEYADMQNELISETGSMLKDIDDDTDILEEGIIQVNNSVDSIIEANTSIMDNITNLSATSEEVSAATDTALALSDSAMEALRNMNALLDEINQIAISMENVVSQ